MSTRVEQAALIVGENPSSHVRIAQDAIIIALAIGITRVAQDSLIIGIPVNQTMIFGGNFQDSLGNPLAGGTLRMQLNADSKTTSGEVYSGLTNDITLDSNGSVPPTLVWSNENLTPSVVTSVTGASSFYRCTVFSAQGQQTWRSKVVIPLRPNPYDIASVIPGSV